ncbi:hypothetical protein EDS67_12395 [candidate division KSB1 bacterium]|nr:MAG: hypothetical protein EDS67_12395 [candidate division KSB1 bacterium]MBC6952331.1 hypothetical protein [candidate division KSB1 bacterium]MCE7944756.1 hypothetical protein [Chlorobi bacterium CHB1]MDL1876741.1 hypothetical protein [Cytophagia bacterium CHB2]
MTAAVTKEPAALLEKKLHKGQRHFTLNEAAASTGLYVDDARNALDELIKKYVCRLQVTENGDLIYDFGKNLLRRGEKTFEEKMAQLRERLWQLFTVIYKAWIAVTLVVYFVLFVIILIALILAMSAGKKDGKVRGPSLETLGNIFASIFRWRTNTGTVLYRTDRRGYPYRQYEPRPSPLNENKKSFIASVYDFVFGPARVEIDPLHNQKEVAAYLRKQNGIIVTSELCALAGWNFPQAETFLTDCLVRFQGEVKVSDNGVMYGQFDELLRGLDKVEPYKIVHYWDEYEPDYQLAGNSPGRNLVIILMNAFNLIFAFYLLTNLLPALTAPGGPADMLPGLGDWIAAHDFAAYLLLGWIPLIFSVLFFAIPLLRWFKISKARRQRHRNNIRKRLFKAIYQENGNPQTAAQIHQIVNTGAREEQLPVSLVESVLREVALDLPGDTLVSAEGQVQYAFPRIGYELKEVTTLRSQSRRAETLGKIIMDSEN